MSGEKSLQQMIASLQRLGQIDDTAAPDCARAVLEVLKDNCRKHVDPYGKKWAPRKEDGKPALDGADETLRVGAVENKIIIRTTGPNARHHLGKGTGHVVRKQIPDQRRLPDNINEALLEAVANIFNQTVRPK